jgi:hypothetical protein
MKRTQSDFLEEVINEINKLDIQTEVDSFVKELRGNKPPRDKKKPTKKLLNILDRK